MTAIPEPGPTPLVFVDEPGKSYSEQLAAYEARRRAADKILLAKDAPAPRADESPELAGRAIFALTV